MSNPCTDLPLNKRHISQIIRRKMIQKVKPDGRIYDRKKQKSKTFFD